MLNSGAMCFGSALFTFIHTCLAENLTLRSGLLVFSRLLLLLLSEFLLKQIHAFRYISMAWIVITCCVPPLYKNSLNTELFWFDKDLFDNVSTFVAFICLE